MAWRIEETRIEFRARGRVVEQGTADELDDDCPEELRKGRVWRVHYDDDKDVFPTPESCLFFVAPPRPPPDAPAAPATPDADRAPGAPVTPEDEDGPPSSSAARCGRAAGLKSLRDACPDAEEDPKPRRCFSEDANPSRGRTATSARRESDARSESLNWRRHGPSLSAGATTRLALALAHGPTQCFALRGCGPWAFSEKSGRGSSKTGDRDLVRRHRGRDNLISTRRISERARRPDDLDELDSTTRTSTLCPRK